MQAATAPPAYPEIDSEVEKVQIDAAHQHAAIGMNTSINVPIQMQPQPQPQLQTLSQFSIIPSSQIAVISHAADAFQGRLCTGCQLPLRTRVGYRATCKTHITFVLCCIFCCWLCAPFVYCVDSCREPQAYCQACGRMVLV